MTKQIGDAEGVLKGVRVGGKLMFPSHARRVNLQSPSRMVTGIARNTDEVPENCVTFTSFMNRCRREADMKYEELEKKFVTLHKERSEVMKDIEHNENEINSILERISRSNLEKDDFAKANDKRKHLRKETVELNHKKRELEAQIQLIVQPLFLLEAAFLNSLELREEHD